MSGIGSSSTRSGAFALMSNVTTLLSGIVSFVILARVLSPAEFGVWALFLTVTSFMEMARVGLVQNSFVKYAANAEKTDWENLMTSAATISAISAAVTIAVVLGIRGILARLWHEPSLGPLLAAYWPMAIAYTPVVISRYVQQTRNDFRSVMLTNLVYRAFFLVALIAEVALTGRIVLGHLPWMTAIAGVAATPIGFLTIRADFRFSPRVLWSQVWELVSFGRYVFATNLGSMLFNRVDLMILGGYVSIGQIAVYNVPQRLGNYVDVPLTSVSSIVFPRAAAIDRKGHLLWLYERSVGAMLAMLVPVAVVMLIGAPWIVWLAAGEFYANSEAVNLLRIVALISLARPYTRQFGVIADAMGSPHVNAALSWLSVAVSVALNTALIPRFGLYGAIIGTFVSGLVGGGIGIAFLKRRLGISLLRPWAHAWGFYVTSWPSLARLASRGKTVNADLVKEKP